MVIPELGLAGMRHFRVRREVPGWWLCGPNGDDVRTLLHQYQSAVGLIVRDALPEARLLYEPWLAVFGLSADAGRASQAGALYPSSAELA